MINGPEGFTPDNEFCLGETEVRGPVRGGRVLRPRPRGRGRRGQGDGRVDRRRRAVDGPVADGRPPLRRRSTARPRYTLGRVRETYETYYDIHYPYDERQAGRPLRASPAYDWHRRARRGLRREVGLGAGELVRVERGAAATSRCGRAAGRASTGRPPSAPSTAACREARRAVRRVVVREARGGRPGRRASCSSACATTDVARDVGRDHLHADAQLARRHRVRLHRHPARRGALLDRHRHGVRQPRPRVDPPPRCPTTASVRVRDVDVRAGPASGSGGRGPRDVLAPADPARRSATTTSRT